MTGKFHEDTSKKRKGAKTAARHDWPKLHMAQYDWLKGKIWPGVNRLFFPNGTDYVCCNVMGEILPITIIASIFMLKMSFALL